MSVQGSARGRRRTRSTARTAVTAVVAAAVALVTLAAPGTQAAAGLSRAEVGAAAGDSWQVSRTSGGYRVELRTVARLSARAAVPLVVADGRVIGVGRPTSPHTLVVTTTDPSVAAARQVTWRWDIGSPSGAGSPGAQGDPADDAVEARLAAAARLAADPGAPGPHVVRSARYDLGDTAWQLPAMPGLPVEARGVVFWPAATATGPRPVVAFLHGMHDQCFGDGPIDFDNPWPCQPGMRSVPSYRGYDAFARVLASHGYVVVSISANAVNAYSNRQDDRGNRARGELILRTLDQWRAWSRSPGGPFGDRFVGRLDFDQIGLMGHSRGGEGAVRAALLNARRDRPYGIRAVLPLAPTDVQRTTLPDTAMSVLLPECDGDVADLQGLHYFDDTRYVDDNDEAARSAVIVRGANHNFWNTEWTPGLSAAPSGDDWPDDTTDQVCGPTAPRRLSAADQQEVGKTLVAGFFRTYLGGERAFLPLFDGSGAVPAGFPTRIDVQAQQPQGSRMDLARFDGSLGRSLRSGALDASICAGTTSPDDEWIEGVPRRDDWCSTTLNPWQAPQWVPSLLTAHQRTTSVAHLTWTGAGALTVPVPSGGRDISRYEALTFRAAPDPAYGRRSELVVRFTDGGGRSVDVAASSVSPALRRMAGSQGVLGKVVLRQVRVPVRLLASLDRTDIRSVQLRTSGTGGAYVADLAFARAALGTGGPPDLPQISVRPMRAIEGSAPATREVTVVLDRPATQVVRAHLEINRRFDEGGNVLPRVVSPGWLTLVMQPGQRVARVQVTVPGDDLDQDDERAAVTAVAARHGAVGGDDITRAILLDDDPTPTLTIGNGTARESDGVLLLPITLSEPSGRFVLVAMETTDGTAVVEDDYGFRDASEGYFGFIEPGATTGFVEIPLTDDAQQEATETFTASVLNLIGTVVSGPSTVTGTITDDD